MSETSQVLAAAVKAVGGEPRAGQVEMALAVEKAIKEHKHLLVQAGTGTGKSLAYLAPALTMGQPVVVATATLALQRQILQRDLPAISKEVSKVLKREISWAILKGRSHYVCRDKVSRGPADENDGLFEAPISNLAQQAKKLNKWIAETPTGDRDDLPEGIDQRLWRGVSVTGRECIGAQKCSFAQDCFSEIAKENARSADLIITNHALLAIDAIEGLPVLPDHVAVIVDEGHELIDRATSAVSKQVSPTIVQRCANAAKHFIEIDDLQDIDDAAEALGLILDEHPAGRINELSESLASALARVRDILQQVITQMRKNKPDANDLEESAAYQRVRGELEEVQQAVATILQLDQYSVLWIDESRRQILNLAPLSVAGILKENLFEKKPVILTSATLKIAGSFDSLAQGLGLSAEEATALDVGSPFDFAKQGILYVASHLPAPDRDGLSKAALSEMRGLIETIGGRTLLLMSSWRAVTQVSEELADLDFNLLVAKKGEGVSFLIEQFSQEETSVLIGTIGLWQGVDIPGASASLVIIDKIPFPRPDDPIISGRSALADSQGKSGFASVSLPKAALLLAQGVGRLIRSSNDKGMVAVLDPRLVNSNYAKRLINSLPPFWLTTDPKEAKESLARLKAEIEG
jgi:ATP-dependent DNA helicase DinG